MIHRVTRNVCAVVFCWIALCCMAPGGNPAAAQQDDAADDSQPAKPAPQKLDSGTLRAQALTALQKGNNQAAIAAADAMIRQNPDQPRTLRIAGDIYLRTGKVKMSTRLFNRFVKAEPDEMPYLWQRGISLYFTGDYEEGAKQFESHREVNPNDVENAAWHFLCVAKAKSPAEARRLVLPAPGDPRAPMEEVLAMLSDGDTEAVTARIQSFPDGSDARHSAAFYGDFYLGLYADALGEKEKATKHLKRSAKDAPRNYMGDVARVYAKFLEEQ